MCSKPNDTKVSTFQERHLQADIDRIAAEKEKLVAETRSLHMQAKRYECEIADINSRLGKPWYHIRLVSLIQATMAGIVAGVLVWAFVIDHIIKLGQIQVDLEKDQQTLKEKIRILESDKESLKDQVDDYRNQVVKLESEQSATSDMKEFASQQLKDLSSLQQKYATDTQKTWFAVIASTYNEKDLKGRLQSINNQQPEYGIEIYMASDKHGVPVYAITLGGYLTKAEAMRRVNYAKEANIASDAYTWSSTRWGEDISGRF